MYVLHFDHDESDYCADLSTARAGDLHGHIGAIDDVEPDDGRPRIGFRLRERVALVGGFPRGPALSWDGKTWTPL